jgi:hypothetical protein
VWEHEFAEAMVLPRLRTHLRMLAVTVIGMKTENNDNNSSSNNGNNTTTSS